MPSQRSTYSKIRQVLEIRKSVRCDSVKALREEIRAHPPDLFRTLQYDPKKDTLVRRASATVIRQTVRMCVLLRLLDDEGALTDLGRRALQPAEFDGVVARQARGLLKKHGADIAGLNEIITEGFQATPPRLPTSALLQQLGGGNTPKGLFSKLLTLLVHCGAAESSQRKLYLHISAR